MKRKVLALFLAAVMTIQPLSVAGAAEFTDGQQVEVESVVEDLELGTEKTVDVFTDEVPEEPVVEEEKVEEGSVAPSETAVQMGDDVWAEYDKANGIVTISGTGKMWDYLEDGMTLDKKHKTPFWNGVYISELIINDGITSIGDYAFTGEYGYRNSIKKMYLSKGLLSIGERAFWNRPIDEINFPDKIISIGDGAFATSRIKNVTFHDGLLRVGRNAFSGNDFERIDIPNSVKEVGEGCFSGCRKLVDVKLSNNITNLPDNLFSGNSALKTISGVDSVKTIGMGCFFRCEDLEQFVSPASLEYIYVNAFYGCINLKTVTFGKTVKMIDESAFTNCLRLQEVVFLGNKTYISANTFKNSKFLKIIKGYDCSGVKTYYNSLPEDQKQKITFVSLGEGTHEWSTEKVVIKEPTCEVPGKKAFKCSICGGTKDSEDIIRKHQWSWESETPATCEKEGVMTYRCSYYNCNGTKTEPIEALGHNWSEWTTTKEPTEAELGKQQRKCWRCDKVETKDIPKLSPIRFEYAGVNWQNYDKLSVSARVNKSVYFYVECKNANDPEPKFDESKLDKTVRPGNNIWKEIPVPEEAVTVYLFVQDADGNNTYAILEPYYADRPEKPATTIKVGDNITATIEGDTLTLTGSGATYDWGEDDWPWYRGNQDEIKKVVFNGNITRIGNFFFDGFKGINKIKLPDGITELGENVFSYCVGLEELEFPSTLKKIRSFKAETYGGDVFTNLKTVIIPEGISEISSMAFDGCKQLKNVYLPSTLEKIGDRAFANCGSLSQIKLPENLISIGNEVFVDCTSLESINLPERLGQMGYNVFAGCSMLNELIFPSSLKTIPSIGGCGITKVTIPEGVVELGYGVFSRCNNLSDIQFPSTIERIGEDAFEFTGITSITWPEKVTIIPDGAFLGSAIKEFTVPNTVEEISNNAFISCHNLTKITIPGSVKYIGEATFLNSRNVTIYGDRDSVAERYAYINLNYSRNSI